MHLYKFILKLLKMIFGSVRSGSGEGGERRRGEAVRLGVVWVGSGPGQNGAVARSVGAPRGGGPTGGGPEGWVGRTQKKWSPKDEAQREEGGAEGCGAQNFPLFFLLPPPCSLFLSLSGGLLVEVWWCLKRRDPQMCTFGFSGCRVKPGPIWKGVPRRGVARRMVRENGGHQFNILFQNL